jgi:hypothetical protein
MNFVFYYIEESEGEGGRGEKVSVLGETNFKELSLRIQ